MRLRSAVAVLLALALLPGCWDRKELNEVAVVLGVGIDGGEQDRFVVTAQVIKPVPSGTAAGAGGSELPTWSVTAAGDTFLDAISELNRVSPRRLYWPHLQIVIFGEQLAKEGIAPAITWFEKSRDSRSGTFVVVTRGKAADILNKKIELGSISSKAMADLLGNAQIRQLPARQLTLRTLTTLLATPGVDVAMDVIDPEEIRGRVETFELSGAAFFDGDKLAGYITNEAVHGLAIASNTYANATIRAACPRESEGRFTYQITDFDSRMRVKEQGGDVTASFDIFVEGNLLDQTCKEDLLDEAALSRVERRIAEKIEKMLKTMFERAAEKQSDVYGIGRELHRRDPAAWKSLESRWDEKLKDVRIKTDINANVRRTGLVIDPTINKIE